MWTSQHCPSGRPGRHVTDLSKVRYLLFDHDGVLVDTEYWYYAATRRALSELGVNLTLEHYRQHLVDGTPSWALASEAGYPAEAVDEARRKRNLYYQGHLRTENIHIPGVLDVLAALAARYDMAIVTTSKRDDFEVIHEPAGIPSFMQFVLAREDYDLAKPHPEPYLEALARLGGRAEEALVIEDSLRGLTAAVAAGISCAVVHNDFTAHQDLSAAQFRLGSLDELPALLGLDATR